MKKLTVTSLCLTLNLYFVLTWKNNFSPEEVVYGEIGMFDNHDNQIVCCRLRPWPVQVDIAEPHLVES